MLRIFCCASSSLAASTESLTSLPVVSIASNLNVAMMKSSAVRGARLWEGEAAADPRCGSAGASPSQRRRRSAVGGLPSAVRIQRPAVSGSAKERMKPGEYRYEPLFLPDRLKLTAEGSSPTVSG